jgi:tetratricopeptide (TPR) repeat protein/tRNA A-37 threonylcarbamoyl transferase component Bud32
MNLNREQFALLERLFAQAAELPAPLRAALLARVRDEDGAEMANHLAALLAAQSEPTESMIQPLAGPARFQGERPTFREGEVILNRFRILRLLGRGGMGEVYEAQDSEIGRVALKTIREDVRSDRLLQRFRQEVQIARMVTSPYVCRIHEFFTLPAAGHGRPLAFLTMELLEGVTLADRIADVGPLPWRDAEAIALQLCQGLEAIHSRGIVHRDFKSRNVMLTQRNGAPRAVVMDLGLARAPELEDGTPMDRTPLTLAGTIMGTPAYMAPEQFEGGTVSAATDLYAFGVVLYEMVTGRLPFEATTPIAAAVRRAKRPPSASSVQPNLPRRWDTVIETCLEFEPAKRFPSVADLAAALQPHSPSSASLFAWMTNRSARNRVAFLLGAVALVAALVVGLTRYRASVAHRTPEAAQAFYRDATSAFHSGTYLTSTRQLQGALKLDDDFVLAHARLADALIELDSTGEAQREVNQIKEELVSQLSPNDRTYVRAVRATIRMDSSSAVTDYEKLLRASTTSSDRANALVDLGRADERAGKIGDAIRCYSQAAEFNRYSPTPFLRRGILRSRQGKQKEADSDFALADAIYRTSINLEGTAEVDYQRSYVASKLGPVHDAEARKFFRESLDAAEKMQSVGLKVRALSRLSAIEYGAAHDEEAGRVAGEAIQLAEENGIAYWATDARIRLGNSWIYRDRQHAERILETSRKEASRNQWPRLLALSELSLASLAVREQTQERQQQTIDLASPAAGYYRTFGYAQESIQCKIMLSRAKSFFGMFGESLQHAREALELSNTLGAAPEILQAQEAIASALFSKEDYSEALDYATSAFQIAEAMPSDANRAHYLAVEGLLRSQILCRLGRTDEATSLIATIHGVSWNADNQTKGGLARFQAEAYKSKGKYREMIATARRGLRDASSDQQSDFQLLLVEGLARTGNAVAARALSDQLLKTTALQNPVVTAQAKLAEARVLLSLQKWQPARALAEEACQFFHSSGMIESELIGLWIVLRSYNGDPAETRSVTKKIENQLSRLKEEYGEPNYQSFIRRSDIAEILPGGTTGIPKR